MDVTPSQAALGKYYTVAEKREIIEHVQQTRVKIASEKSGASRAIIYRWLKLFKEKGLAGLEDGRQHNTGAKPIADWKRTKVLAVKETDPGFGPS